MAPLTEQSQLKRQRGSLPEDATDAKKPRRSDRLSSSHAAGPVTTTTTTNKNKKKTPIVNKQHLPSPLTNITNDDSMGDASKNGAASPSPPVHDHDHDQRARRKTDETWVGQQSQALSPPPQDTQPHSQYLDRHPALSDEVEDEVKEGVWGYLVPLDPKYGDKPFVLKRRNACPLPDSIAEAAANGKDGGSKEKFSPLEAAEAYERTKISGNASGGYLIGRHAECDFVVKEGVVSNRHCLFFTENKGTDTVAIVEDLSSNGTYVNEALVGRNQRRELEDQDEIAVHGKARFVFRYPQSRHTNAFLQEYTLLEKLGKGHFAEVYLCIEKASGHRYAVKIFSKTPGVEDRSKTEGLQQEIGVLMSVSHPNVLCLKDTFNERDRVYLVLELAAEGELFNYIVMKGKLSEEETRKLFLQLFQGIKYL
ncbi:hypothetical protein E4U10_004195, partial [Claviceps purpurea]